MKRLTPTLVEIHRKDLRFNFRQLKQRTPKGTRLMCVVKSNAYGHGAPEVASIFEKAGADFFGVGTIDEGIALRKSGIKKPILILLGILEGHYESLLRFELIPVVYDLENAKRLNTFLKRKNRRCPIHIKVDTGMTRLGVLSSQFRAFCLGLKKLSFLEPTGLMTHFAEAGDRPFTKKQRERFHEAKELFEKNFPEQSGKAIFHLANSQASIDQSVTANGKASSVRGNETWMARLGIALYGAYPLDRDRRVIPLRQSLRWKTRIVQIKKVPKGTFVSYNRTFRTKRTSRIGVLPVGYADGYFRNLSNKSEVLIHGKRVPILGIVCMDMTMIDLTDLPKSRVGDEVVLLGRQGKSEIRAEELAEKLGTIPYEIFLGISDRVPRVYV